MTVSDGHGSAADEALAAYFFIALLSGEPI
jgi:hypothetical protein